MIKALNQSPESNEGKVDEKLSFLAAIVQSLESSDNAIIGKTLDGMIVSWNKGAQQLYGYSEDEVIGKPISILMPSGQKDEMPAILAKICNNERVQNYETVMVNKKDNKINVLLSISPIKDGKGRIIGAATIARNITEHRKADDERLRLAAIVESSDDAILSMTTDGIITSWNKGAEKMFGYAANEVVGNSIRIIDPQNRPDELPEIIEKMRRGERIEQYETQRKQKDDMLIDVSLSVFPIRSETGKIIGISKILRDISNLKRVSQYARSLIEASLDPLVTISLEGKITDVNEATIKVTGVPREKLIGTDFSIYFTSPENAREGYERAFKEGFVTDYPLTIKSATGKITDVLYNATVYKDYEGNVLGVFAAARDYTRLKQAKQQLEETNKELEAFSYSISHDLRAPLRAIDGFANILMEDHGDKLDSDGKRKLETIMASSRRMGRLIDDLLSLSRSGRQKLNMETVDMNNVVRIVLDELKEISAGRNIDYTIKELPLCHCDPSLIRQVWVNLISNAIKFTRTRNPATIEFGGKSDGDSVIYYVKDNGVGFSMDYANKLFKVFNRLHDEKEFEGTGVGLAIVQQIIRRHGGMAWAKGEAGKGATFYFMLPSTSIKQTTSTSKPQGGKTS